MRDLEDLILWELTGLPISSFLHRLKALVDGCKELTVRDCTS